MHRQGHRVSGAAGCELYVEETGNPEGQPILFIHGISQCRLAWNRQLDSELRRDMRLVAMDLRGHGRSQRPRDAYGEPSLWADDIHAVITTLGLRRPSSAAGPTAESSSVTTSAATAKRRSAGSSSWARSPCWARR